MTKARVMTDSELRVCMGLTGAQWRVLMLLESGGWDYGDGDRSFIGTLVALVKRGLVRVTVGADQGGRGGRYEVTWLGRAALAEFRGGGVAPLR